MKRSEINQILREAKDFLASRQFVLPEWAGWSLSDWKANRQKVDYIVERMLGWDITDFGSGDFLHRGLFLFTIRNGKYGVDKKPYAEKIMIVEENQKTPISTGPRWRTSSTEAEAIWSLSFTMPTRTSSSPRLRFTAA